MPATRQRNPRILLLTALGSMGLVAAYLYGPLNFDGFSWDVQFYWKDSLAWSTPFSKDHVPGYPLLIAGLRGATLNLVPPLLLMCAITCTAKIVGTIYVFRTILADRNEGAALIAAILFLLWPMVGIVFAIFPISDVLAMTFVILGIHCFRKKEGTGGAIWWGLALITHKALWPVVASLVMLDFLTERREERRIDIRSLGVMLLPLLALWGGGWWYHSTPMWMLENSIDVQGITKGSIPIAKTVEAQIQASESGFLRIAAIWLTIALCLGLVLAAFVKNEVRSRGVMAGIPLGIVLLAIVTNEQSLWIAVRFSPLLAISIGLRVPDAWLQGRYGKRFSRAVISLAAVLLASQICYAWAISSLSPSIP